MACYLKKKLQILLDRFSRIQNWEKTILNNPFLLCQSNIYKKKTFFFINTTRLLWYVFDSLYTNDGYKKHAKQNQTEKRENY